MKLILLLTFVFIFNHCSFSQNKSAISSKPKVSFTFDDGSTKDMPGYKLEVWNEMILSALNKHNLKAVLFATGKNLQGEKGKYVISSWNNAGHRIGNHTYSHKNFNSDKVSLEDYESDFLSNDSLIGNYRNFYHYFRFPFLKEGNTKEKIEGFREFLSRNNYKNGHVTIDNSDWYINSRLVNRLQENPASDIQPYKDYYINHLFVNALKYDSMATAITNRKISHVLLLHHNLAAALFLDDLIEHFKENGWEVIDAEEAFKDEIYNSYPSNIPAGESLIWALAKESGRFEDVLKYPAEDGDYEKERMDKLGL